MQYTTIPFEVNWSHQKLSFEVDSLYHYLDRVIDQRHPRGLLYPLRPLLAIAILAKLCGQNHLAELAHWAKLRAESLCQIFGLSRGTMPHLTTWARILGEKIDLVQFQIVINEFFRDQLELARQVPARGSQIIAIDGKALRGSIASGERRGDYLMAAYLPDQGVVIGQVEVANGEVKENEISAAPKLMSQISKCVEGAVVVGDAMQCQRQLSLHIRENKGDWLWFVKENQPNLLEYIKILFEHEPLAAGHGEYPTDFETYSQIEKGHGRVEERKITISSMLDAEYLKWPSVAQVFKWESWVRRGRDKPESYQLRYGITSLPRELANPQRIFEIARAEWQIENSLHYRRDYTLREDWSKLRLGQGQKINAIINNLVVGVGRLAGKENLPAFRRELEYDPNQALTLLTKPIVSTR